jgi:hypothetical protein
VPPWFHEEIIVKAYEFMERLALRPSAPTGFTEEEMRDKVEGVIDSAVTRCRGALDVDRRHSIIVQAASDVLALATTLTPHPSREE